LKGPQGLFIYQDHFSMTSPFTYLKHVREEFKHVVWPSNRTAIAHTLVVIGIAAIIALLVSLLDYVFGLGVNKIIGG
jgi:preprotein translocase subunit SecE